MSLSLVVKLMCVNVLNKSYFLTKLPCFSLKKINIFIIIHRL
jgi:hypothetical protein